MLFVSVSISALGHLGVSKPDVSFFSVFIGADALCAIDTFLVTSWDPLKKIINVLLTNKYSLWIQLQFFRWLGFYCLRQNLLHWLLLYWAPDLRLVHVFIPGANGPGGCERLKDWILGLLHSDLVLHVVDPLSERLILRTGESPEAWLPSCTLPHLRVPILTNGVDKVVDLDT